MGSVTATQGVTSEHMGTLISSASAFGQKARDNCSSKDAVPTNQNQRAARHDGWREEVDVELEDVRSSHTPAISDDRVYLRLNMANVWPPKRREVKQSYWICHYNHDDCACSEVPSESPCAAPAAASSPATRTPDAPRSSPSFSFSFPFSLLLSSEVDTGIGLAASCHAGIEGLPPPNSPTPGEEAAPYGREDVPE